MTEDEKYEIATLAEDVAAKSDVLHALWEMNTPSDPAERAKVRIAIEIARTEYLQAENALAHAQARIVNKAQC